MIASILCTKFANCACALSAWFCEEEPTIDAPSWPPKVLVPNPPPPATLEPKPNPVGLEPKILEVVDVVNGFIVVVVVEGAVEENREDVKGFVVVVFAFAGATLGLVG